MTWVSWWSLSWCADARGAAGFGVSVVADDGCLVRWNGGWVVGMLRAWWGGMKMTKQNETLIHVKVTDKHPEDDRVVAYYWANGNVGGAVKIEVRPTGRGNYYGETHGFDGYRWVINLKSKYMPKEEALDFAARRWVKAQEWLLKLIPSTYESRIDAIINAA